MRACFTLGVAPSAAARRHPTDSFTLKLGGLTAGQTVLIHAAAGATGQAATILAKHHGATVIGTAAPGEHETVLAAGADHVLDSRAADLASRVRRLTGGAGVDLVLESAGGSTFEHSLAAAQRVCNGPAPARTNSNPSPRNCSNPPIHGPAPCSTATSRPSNAPTRACSNRSCAPMPHWRRRRSATGSRGWRTAFACSTSRS
ncbi:zinc-binding dehydrogenase [Nocardia sp. NPDC004582]